MKATSLVHKETLELDFSGDFPEGTPSEDTTLTVTIDPGVMTPAIEAEMRAAGDDNSESVVGTFASLVTAWDMLDDAGVVIPLTTESLMHQPTALLMKVIGKIGDTMEEKVRAEGKS